MASDRVTTKKLWAAMDALNTALNRPVSLMATHNPVTYNVGHLHLDNMNPGDGRSYVIEEVKAHNSSYRPMGNTRYNLHDMYLIVSTLARLAEYKELQPLDYGD